jgi:hypothetical protein
MVLMMGYAPFSRQPLEHLTQVLLKGGPQHRLIALQHLCVHRQKAQVEFGQPEIKRQWIHANSPRHGTSIHEKGEPVIVCDANETFHPVSRLSSIFALPAQWNAVHSTISSGWNAFVFIIPLGQVQESRFQDLLSVYFLALPFAFPTGYSFSLIASVNIVCP